MASMKKLSSIQLFNIYILTYIICTFSVIVICSTGSFYIISGIWAIPYTQEPLCNISPFSFSFSFPLIYPYFYLLTLILGPFITVYGEYITSLHRVISNHKISTCVVYSPQYNADVPLACRYTCDFAWVSMDLSPSDYCGSFGQQMSPK